MINYDFDFGKISITAKLVAYFRTFTDIPFAAEVAEIKADGDHTVVLTLKQGNADYPFILSTGAFSIVPSKDGKADPATGVGTLISVRVRSTV